MERKVFAAGESAVSVISTETGRLVRCAQLERAGALCAARRRIFCACGAGVASLDPQTLSVQASFAAGPGIGELLLSADGVRLYALCADGDSVLMLDACSGQPLILCPAGVNPRQMALGGGMLAIAGGGSGDVPLLCAHTLRMKEALRMPGPVYSVAIARERLYALCMTPALSSLLVTLHRGAARSLLPLDGLPGRLLLRPNALYAATYGWLYRIAPDGREILGCSQAPGCAAWLDKDARRLLLLDGVSQTLFASQDDGLHWRAVCSGVCAASLCPA